jgi:hypothetical protein
MKKGFGLLLFTVAAAICLLMGNLPAATNFVTCGTWLPELGVGTVNTTVAAVQDQVQIQAVQIEEDIGAAVNSDVLAVASNIRIAQTMALQSEIMNAKVDEVKSPGSSACLLVT